MNIQCFFKVVLLSLSLLVAGVSCRSKTPPSLELTLLTSPSPQSGTCPSSGFQDLPKDGSDGVRFIRMTFFDAEPGPPTAESFLCDRLVTAAERRSPFYVQASSRSRVHIRMEAFGGSEEVQDATRLVASSFLEDVILGTGLPQEVYLPMAERTGCTLGAMSLARAFHSATALPRGAVLLVGGIVAARGDSRTVDTGRGFLLTDSIEIYHSGQGRFQEPMVTGEPGVRRAFHDAFLLPNATANRARVLLVGGVGQGSVSEAGGAVLIRQGPQHPFRLTPAVDARPATAELLTVDLTTDPPTVHRSAAGLGDWPGRYFQGSAGYGPNGGATIAGGATGVEALGTFQGSSSIDFGHPETGEYYPVPGTMLLPRVGLSLSTMDATAILAWGGNLEQVDLLGTLAERVLVSPAPPASTILAYDALGSTLATPVATVFHTATVLDGGDLLVVGGFEITGGVALDPADVTAIHRVRFQGNSLTMHGQASDGFVPVGYHAIAKLSDGRVLITGGSPKNQATLSHCQPGQLWTCSLPQAFVYTQGAYPADPGVLHPLPGQGLVVSRFGHRMVLLSSGAVLILGGIRQEGAALFTEASAEVFNPASGVASEDAPLFRAPGSLFSEESECPVFR